MYMCIYVYSFILLISHTYMCMYGVEMADSIICSASKSISSV